MSIEHRQVHASILLDDPDAPCRLPLGLALSRQGQGGLTRRAYSHLRPRTTRADTMTR
jgi:hypothetical protein